MTRMDRYVVDLRDVNRNEAALAGGKGANLGELARIDGVRVPPGIVVTTNAFHDALAAIPGIEHQLDRLSRVSPTDQEALRFASAEVRERIERATVPRELAAAITDALMRLGARSPCAVRSSATAEDLPSASFAGQHDSYLDVVGSAAILEHVRRCWGSLFTDRAVAYRLRNGIGHQRVRMAVIVQQMIAPRAAGILFTADPVTGNRKVASVEATLGLGDALVSGRVNADVYTVRDRALVAKTTAAPSQPVLTDAECVRLVELGRRIEGHFGRPQDIEWCLAGDEFHIVQSRPITTLFPVPNPADGAKRVYLSVGHQQMMTDAIRPLGISVRELTAAAQFHEAGGRQFVDVSRMLATAAGRAGLLGMAGKSDPLTGDALRTIIERDFIPLLPDHGGAAPPPAPPPLPTDSSIVSDLTARTEESITTLKREIQGRTGTALLDFIRGDFQELKRILTDPRTHQVIMAGTEATWWLNDRLEEWLGEKGAADTLSQSVANNITSEMGLALLDVADVIRPHAEVVAFLERADHEQFLDELPRVPGGSLARDAIRAWLDRYGMRCAGEIDITRPRWAECPTIILPMLLGNVRSSQPGAGRRRFEEGLVEAAKKEREVLASLRALPDGARKAEETKAMIDRLRTFVGYREYPKYAIVCRYFVYRIAMLEEAARLQRSGVLREREDIYFLTFDEFQNVVRSGRVDDASIRQRKELFREHQLLTPPRVMTSEGEVVAGSYRREDLPPGALAGLPVSAGTVEGRARVILRIEDADIESGDILVTTFTDPSWTPLFVAIAGLVTEIGGLMTHGAVIAREYGLPAVVGVEDATRRIRDGQRIRVHGTDGYVEILPGP